MSNPKVSVVINNYNKAPYLKECLESVINQTYENWEIIFWDDNSDDNSYGKAWEILEPYYPEKVQFFHTRCEMKIWEKPTVPLGVLRWMAFKKTIGRYICILDADDYWSFNKLQKQVEYMEANNVGVCFSDCNYLETKEEAVQVEGYPAWTTEKRSQYLEHTFHDKYPVLKGDDFINLLTRYNYIPALTLMFRKESLWEVMGGPTHYTSGEDYDWLLKITNKYKAGYIPECLATYRINVPGSVNKTLSSSLQSTWNEICCVRDARNYRELTWNQRRKYYQHLIYLYCKLIWKQGREIRNE